MEGSESVQQLMLNTLDREGVIADTGALRLNGSPVDQQTVLGVLKRLAAHEVRCMSLFGAEG